MKYGAGSRRKVELSQSVVRFIRLIPVEGHDQLLLLVQYAVLFFVRFRTFATVFAAALVICCRHFLLQWQDQQLPLLATSSC